MSVAISGYSQLSSEDKHRIGNFLEHVPMGNMDLSSIKNSDLLTLQKLLTPKTTKYIGELQKELGLNVTINLVPYN